MTCRLCEREIAQYEPRRHRLVLDDGRAVDLCSACIERLLHWQQQMFTTLFPTTAAKKRLRRK